MSKRFMFLISFILVLGLSGAVQAANPIDVNNPSFELGNDGNQIPGHTGIEGVLAWDQDGPEGFVGVDVFCPYADGTHCHSWPGSDYNETAGTGVTYAYVQHTGVYMYQVLDPNIDPNSRIVPGNQYTLTFDGMGWDGDQLEASIFYVDDYNFPDVNHHEIASRIYPMEEIPREVGDCNVESPEGPSVLNPPDECYDWDYNLTVKFVAEAGQDCIGKVLGIKLSAKSPGAYSFVDNVRLDWDYATYAYNPYPADGETDVPKNVTVNWKSGTYTQATNGHLVFFGTSYAEVYDANTNDTGIYKGPQNIDANSYPSGTLVLGKSYYWRIDEVNSAHTTPPPPVGPWVGDVWSFEVAGYATNPQPADGEVNVPFLDLTLYWTAGTEATSHDVYFGTDYADVDNANSSDPNGPTEVFRSKAQTDPNYPVPESFTTGLTVGQTYYWRIDEQSSTMLLKGKIWSFTIGQFLIVDDFDGYANQNELYAVWDDYWVNYIDGSDKSFIYLETDPNFVLDGNSLRYVYNNTSFAKYIGFPGSWIDAQDPAELEVGSDWTVGGVKALTLYFMGDPCNTFGTHKVAGVPTDDYGGSRLWVELEDVGTDVGLVKHTDVNQIKEAEWHEWNIALSDFSDACSVDLVNLDRVTIGIGGSAKAGQGITETDAASGKIYIDDIRLYPPRCFPELAQIAGNLNDDCIIDVCDLQIMARDWVISDCIGLPVEPTTPPIVRYKFDEGSGTIAANTGTYDSSYDVVLPGYLDTNGVFGVHPNHAPVWLDDPNRGWCLRFDGEGGMWPGVPAAKTELMLGGDYLVAAPLDLTTDTMSITAWIKPNPTFGDGEEFKDGFTGIVTTRIHATINPPSATSTEAAGLNFGGGGGFVYDGMLGYTWNNNGADTWNWDSLIYPTNLEWNLVAVTVSPDSATVYIVDESSTVLETATNTIAHSSETLDVKLLIGGDVGHLRFFKGDMNDVRIYDYTLSVGEVMGIAGMSGEIYLPNNSVANVVPVTPEPNDYDPNNPDIVNFVDYELMADNWLTEYLWPPD